MRPAYAHGFESHQSRLRAPGSAGSTACVLTYPQSSATQTLGLHGPPHRGRGSRTSAPVSLRRSPSCIRCRANRPRCWQRRRTDPACRPPPPNLDTASKDSRSSTCTFLLEPSARQMKRCWGSCENAMSHSGAGASTAVLGVIRGVRGDRRVVLAHTYPTTETPCIESDGLSLRSGHRGVSSNPLEYQKPIKNSQWCSAANVWATIMKGTCVTDSGPLSLFAW